MNKIYRNTKTLVKSQFSDCIDGSPMLYVGHWIPLGGMLAELSLCERELGPELIFNRITPIESQKDICKKKAISCDDMYKVLSDARKILADFGCEVSETHEFKIRDPAELRVYISVDATIISLRIIGLQLSPSFRSLKTALFDQLLKVFS